VTNYHVLGGQNWDVVFPSTGESYSLKPVLLDKANDIALLRMIPREGKGPATLRPLKIVGSAAAKLGEGVYTIGFPLGELLGSSHKVAAGVLSSGSGLSDDPRMFQITVPTEPGNSGGPVVNEKGEVIGILASSLSVDYLYREQRPKTSTLR
jgi:S1-C subfamily serine protease